MRHASVFKISVLKGIGMHKVVSHCYIRNAVRGRNVIIFSKRILMYGDSGLNWNRATKWIKVSAVPNALVLLVS